MPLFRDLNSKGSKTVLSSEIFNFYIYVNKSIVPWLILKKFRGEGLVWALRESDISIFHGHMIELFDIFLRV